VVKASDALSKKGDPGALSKESGMGKRGGVPWLVVALGFLAVLLDGFDVGNLSFAVPAMSKSWGVGASAFTSPLVLTNVGVVCGYILSGSVGAHIGRKRLLVSAILVYGVFTLLVAATMPLESISLLTVLRLLTGLGLGLVLPVAVSIAADQSPTERRNVVSVTVTLGLASGAALAGFVGGSMLTHVGVAGVFWISGVIPLFIATAILLFVREPEGRAAAGSRHDVKRDASVARLFRNNLWPVTLLLWAFSFFIFIANYTLSSWVPTFMTGYGFSITQAPLGLAFYGLGGVIGGLVLIPLAGGIGIARSLIVVPVFAIICTVFAAQSQLPHIGLLLLLGGAGLGVTAGQIGQLTMAVSVYPPGAETTGVGWSAALGRIGSIVGPAVAGILIAAAISSRNIILLTSVPILISAVCAAFITYRDRGDGGHNRKADIGQA
jgi:AAHS family 4-hydroxybenzoate transporter-like MFS transporter